MLYYEGSMVVISHSANIIRPLPEVWEFLTVPENYLLWQSGLISASATNGTEVGSRITFQTVALGRGFEVEAAVKVNNHRDKLEAVSTRGNFTFTVKFGLKEIPGGTRVSYSSRIDTHGIFQLAVGPLQSMNEVRQRADMEKLKILLEACSPAAEV